MIGYSLVVAIIAPKELRTSPRHRKGQKIRPLSSIGSIVLRGVRMGHEILLTSTLLIVTSKQE